MPLRLLLAISLIAATLGLQATSSHAIVKGSQATLGELPYQVALEDDFGQFCGGSIINTNTILTAAHCLDGMKAADIQIHAGIVQLDTAGQRRQVVRKLVQPNWGGVNGDSSYDIALLFVEAPFEPNANVAAIDAQTAAVDTAATPGTVATVSGWGALGERSNKEVFHLRKTDVSLLADSECNRRLDGQDSIDNFSMICTTGQGNGACYGDSGGPLAVRNANGSFTQVGIVSWGTVCGDTTVAGVYADLANLRPWINQHVAGSTTPATPPDPTPAPEPAPTPQPEPTPDRAELQVFKQTKPMRIPAWGGQGEAGRYPAVLNVAGAGSELTDIDVVLIGLAHRRPSDLDIVLVSPNGTEVTLMADAGGTARLKRTNIRFDDAATQTLPENSIMKGRFLPTNMVPELPSDDLSMFEGEDPNGEWELYVYDAVRGKKGKLKGWKLITLTR